MQKGLVYSPESVIERDGFCAFLQKQGKLTFRIFLDKLRVMFAFFGT